MEKYDKMDSGAPPDEDRWMALFDGWFAAPGDLDDFIFYWENPLPSAD